LRNLVERLWPRGLTKERAAGGPWLKEVAPSPELRTWFGHDPARWEQFQEPYWKELEEKEAAVQLLKQKAKQGVIIALVAGALWTCRLERQTPDRPRQVRWCSHNGHPRGDVNRGDHAGRAVLH
jgi:uncharacterized protein YeaO (DUF488 family)